MPTPPPPIAPGDDDGGVHRRGLGNGAGHTPGDDPGHTPGDDSGHPPGDGSSGPTSGSGTGNPAPEVVVPDDLSELVEDVKAYRRERKAQRRRERLDRLRPRAARSRRPGFPEDGLAGIDLDRPGRSDPGPGHSDTGNGRDGTGRGRAASRRVAGMPGALLVALLVVVGALGALLPLLGARPGLLPQRAPAPLASPAVATGAVGGLLPDVVLTGPSGPVAVRDLRPGVLVLLPFPCRCARAVADLVGQTHETNPLPTYLVAPRLADNELAGLVADPAAGGHRAVGLTDPTGSLAAGFPARPADPTAPTLLLIGADGRLLRPPRSLHAGDRLETWLSATTPVRSTP
ncbi:MAG: hypothetical protein ACQSGP_18185 [Frankia sp.]